MKKAFLGFLVNTLDNGLKFNKFLFGFFHLPFPREKNFFFIGFRSQRLIEAFFFTRTLHNIENYSGFSFRKKRKFHGAHVCVEERKFN